MQKKIGLMVVAIVLLLIVGAVAFMQFNKSSKPSTNAQNSAMAKEENASGDSMTKGTIQSLLSAGKSVTCTYSAGVDESATNGTIFVSDKKMRGDFTVNMQDGKTMDSHMIQNGEYGYFWSSSTPTGTKMKISELPIPSPGTTSQTQTADLNKEYDMKCSSWSVDGSKFTPPADVNFTDMTDVMMKMKTTAPTTKNSGSTSTSPCDQITDPTSKASCVKVMSGGGY